MQHPSITTYYSRQLLGPKRSPIPQNEIECQQSQPIILRNSNPLGLFFFSEICQFSFHVPIPHPACATTVCFYLINNKLNFERQQVAQSKMAGLNPSSTVSSQELGHLLGKGLGLLTICWRKTHKHQITNLKSLFENRAGLGDPLMEHSRGILLKPQKMGY